MNTEIKNSVVSLFRCIADSIFPKKCYSCGRLTDYGEPLCRKCSREIVRINLEKRCKFCGKEKKYCSCKWSVYRFCEVVSVFEYEGVGRNIMLNYKLRCKPHYADFLSQNMAKCIIEAYGDIAVDTICFVPSSIQAELKRGFVPCELLAKKLSKLLLVPCEDALVIAEKRTKQTNVKTAERRLENAVNKYGCTKNLSGKTILLIDDVMTTGATLNDCTRALLFAGAEKVYCATAFVSVYKREKT